MMTSQVLREAAIELSFEGRFGLGIDQWPYVPFDVPPGVHRIDVRTSHDRFSLLGVARNVLDLGIFRPADYENPLRSDRVRHASRIRMRPMAALTNPGVAGG
jgi:hypothetical protein